MLIAVDLKTGKPAWRETLGTIAKASPVFADGKLYIGTENTGDAGGKFYIIRPTAAKAEILDQDWLGTSAEVGTDHRFADRRAWSRLRRRPWTRCMRSVRRAPRRPRRRQRQRPSRPQRPPAAGPATTALVTPTDVIVKPGESLPLSVKLFDANGNPVAGGADATWTLENLKGTVAGGKFVADAAAGAQAGMVKATVGAVSGDGAHPRHPRHPLDVRLRGRRGAGTLDQRHRQVRRPR